MAIGVVLELRKDDWVFIPAADQSLGADCHSWEGYNSSEAASTEDNSQKGTQSGQSGALMPRNWENERLSTEGVPQHR